MALLSRRTSKQDDQPALAIVSAPVGPVAEVDAEIAAYEAELASIGEQIGLLEEEYALSPSDATLDAITRLRERSNQDSKRRPGLDAKRVQAQQHEVVAAHAVRVGALVAQIDELLALKADEHRKALRAELRALDEREAYLLRAVSVGQGDLHEEVNAYARTAPRDVVQAVGAQVEALEKPYRDKLDRGFLSAAQAGQV